MGNWRPENWKNPYTYLHIGADDIREGPFEAGADAMLEALKKEGIYQLGAKPVKFTVGRQEMLMPIIGGWLVFIPEEK